MVTLLTSRIHVFFRCDNAYGIKYVCLRYFNACGADAAGDIGEDHEPETHLIPLVLQVRFKVLTW
jgi:UDP-glucose 4-epimerase